MATIKESADKIKSCLHKCNTYEKICKMEDMIDRFKVMYQRSESLDEELFYINLVLKIRKEAVQHLEKITPYDMSDLVYAEE